MGAKNPFVESRECSLERSLSLSPKDKLMNKAISKSAEIIVEENNLVNTQILPRKTKRGKLEVDYSSGSENGRILFPREAKLDAIQLMKDGKSQSEVAKDLNCSVSTVASWWQRRQTLKKPTKFKKNLCKPPVERHNSSGISLSPSSYDSSEKDGESSDIHKDNIFEETPFYDSDVETQMKQNSMLSLDRKSIINSLKQNVESPHDQFDISNDIVDGTSHTGSSFIPRVEESKQGLDPFNSSPFPLSNILTRRLSNMSNFSSASSSFDETSSDDNGIADNEDDSGENFNLKHKSSLIGTSKKRKCRVLNKKSAKNKYRYNSSSSSKRKKRDFSSSFSDSKNHQSNFKSIQKGIENILNSDALFGEDQVKDKQSKKLEKDFEEDDDSIDNFRLEKE